MGEPGIGKSRLVRELYGRIDARPQMTTWRQGYCQPYGEDATFGALAQIVKGHAGVLDSDEPDVVEAKLEAVLPGGPDRDWLRQRLRALFGLKAPEATRDENFAAWTGFLKEVGAREPTILVFEDLHWADEALLAFLEHLAGRLTAVPVMVVGTTRPELFERRPDFAPGSAFSRIDLQPLASAETARLVCRLLGASAAQASAVQEVVERCDGNPFFAEQSVRLLEEAGSPARLPRSVQAVIAARLDSLPVAERKLLGDAAVVGAVFWEGALSAIEPLRPDDQEHVLSALLRRNLIRAIHESALAGECEFAFVHALAREVAYGQLPRASRAHKHAAVARWLGRATGGRTDEQVEVLAHHYVAALELATAAGQEGLAEELRDPAIDALRRAGDRALGLDIRTAERHYSRALALLGDDEAPPELLSGWATVLAATRRAREAAEVWRRVIARYQAGGQRQAAALAMTGLVEVLEQLSQPRYPTAQAALDLLADDGPSPEFVKVLACYAAYSHLTGALAPAECRPMFDRVIEMAAQLEMPEPALTQWFRGSVLCQLGELEGFDEQERALDVAAAQGLGDEFMNMQYNHVRAVMDFKGPAAAAEAGARLLESARRRGDEDMAVKARHRLMMTHYWSGDWEAASEEARALEGELRAGDDGWTLWTLRITEGLLFSYVGRPEAVASYLDTMVTKGREFGGGRVGQLASAAVVYAAMGETQTACGLVAEAVKRQPGDWRGWATDMGRVARSAGDEELTARTVPSVPEGVPLNRHLLSTCRAMVAEVRGNRESARVAYAEAASGWHDFGMLHEEAEALLGQSRCLVALGRPTEAAASLARARTIFVRLGAKPALAETDVVLARSSGGA